MSSPERPGADNDPPGSAKTPKYRTAPDPHEGGWPKGIPYIIGNEGCERFSYYGMRAILWMYVAMLFKETGVAEATAESDATAVVHTFNAGVYALPMIGAILSDRLLGKYHTILWLSILYTVGHAVLSFTEGTIWGMYAGLTLIAVGSGGIKPCVSAHVGDQFGRANWHLLEKVYQAFYFIINFGSFFATLLIPLTREYFGWSVAFAIPGVLMAIATVFFWMGRHVFIHVPPAPGGKLGLLDTLSGSALFFGTVGALFYGPNLPAAATIAIMAACIIVFIVLFSVRQRIEPDEGFIAVSLYALQTWLSGESRKAKDDGYGKEIPGFFAGAAKRFGEETAEGPVAVLKIMSIFIFVSVFWALFDQHSSSWIQQATMMDRDFGWFSLTPDQIPALNPVMVMVLIAFNNFVLFPGLRRFGFEPSPLKRMTAGMLITASSFVAVALIQRTIDGSGEGVVHVGWQFFPYLLVTMAEVLVSITGLEFAYSQAPRRMKSTVMGFWLLTITFGNFLVAFLARFSGLALEDFFWTFAGLMALAGVLFALRAYFYTPKEYTH